MSSEFLEAAERLGARLCRDALWSNGLCNWTADFATSEKIIGHRALPADLYDGTSGIALFLHRLALVTGERIFRVTAEAALRQACAKLPLETCGLFTGGTGVLYAALELRGEVDAAQLVLQAKLHARNLDVISGSAGVIAVLLAAHRRSQDQLLLEHAILHGELLLSHAEHSEEGLSWPSSAAKKNLTGFSHGAAGIGWALLELHCVTRHRPFLDSALQAFAYERAHFSIERGNWPDFRERSAATHSGAVSFLNAWCHGAPGIGLSRIRAWELIGDQTLLSEADVALKTITSQISSYGNCSLCHGMAGNADILIYAAEKLNRPDLLAIARKAGLEALNRFEHRRLPWPGGLSGANELPDLMLGIAGIGHFYLRLHDPILPTPLLPL